MREHRVRILWAGSHKGSSFFFHSTHSTATCALHQIYFSVSIISNRVYMYMFKLYEVGLSWPSTDSCGVRVFLVVFLRITHRG